MGRREGRHPVVSAADVAPSSFLVTVRGQDAPGIAQRLFAVLGARGVAVDDVEQIRVHGRLLLCAEVRLGSDDASEAGEARAALAACALTEALAGAGVEVAVDPLVESAVDEAADRHLVTLLAPDVDAVALEGVTGCVARCGGNIERIVRLASYPVHSYELSVTGPDLDLLRRALAQEAARLEVDLAVQPAGLHRRAKHLIVHGRRLDACSKVRWWTCSPSGAAAARRWRP